MLQAESLHCSSSQVSKKKFAHIFRELPDFHVSELNKKLDKLSLKGWILPCVFRTKREDMYVSKESRNEHFKKPIKYFY